MARTVWEGPGLSEAVEAEVTVACAGAARPMLGGSYLGLAPRPLYLLPLLRCGVLSTVITREAADIGWDERLGVEMISLEERTRTRCHGNPVRDRDQLIAQLARTVGTRWHGREFGVASYGRYGSRWLTALTDLGVRVRTPIRPRHPALPVDKSAMRDWFAALGVPVPASVVVDHVDYSALCRRFGRVFVAQRPTGTGGSGTYLITDEDTARALPASRGWLVSEYAGDTTVNFHGFIDLDGAASVLRPSVQLTDIDGVGSSFGRYCGSDFQSPALLADSALDSGRESMRRIGAALAQRSYRGLFGVDFIVREGSAVALEVNRRMQGSSWLLGEIEQRAGELPSMVRHVLARHGHTARATPSTPALSTGSGTQLTLRHTGPPARMPTAPRAGVHRLHQDQLIWLATGHGLLECGPAECAIVNLPRPGTLVYPGAILARLITPESLTTPEGTALTHHGQRAITALRSHYSFQPASC